MLWSDPQKQKQKKQPFFINSICTLAMYIPEDFTYKFIFSIFLCVYKFQCLSSFFFLLFFLIWRPYFKM